jgi:Domain of unknown function (DUF1788)
VRRQRTIYERIDDVLPKLMEPQFLENRGIGNEVGFYIFDYEPEHEMFVRTQIVRFKQKLFKAGIPVLEINLFRVILDILEGRGFLEKALTLEAEKGPETLKKALSPLLSAERMVKVIRERITPEHRLVFLTGVGAAWPLVRSHTILNNLHPVIDDIPMVAFFPGSYDGHELRLFSTFKDDNYYRAFPLVSKEALGVQT